MPTNRPITQANSSCDRFFLQTTHSIYVGILTSHSLAAHHLLSLLNRNSNMYPVVLEDGIHSTSSLPAHGRIVIVVDLWGLPLPVSEYLKTFTAASPGCSFLALDKDRNVMDIVQFLRAGFAGFSNYDEARYSLGSAIHAVAAGNIWATTEALRVYLDLTSQRTALQRTTARNLTAREVQVLDLLRKRYSNKEMATWLGVSESTVKFHVSNILMKLNVTSRWTLAENKLPLGPRYLASAEVR